MENERWHLSHSQIAMHARCPVQWEFRYAKGLIVPPGVALVVGGSVHRGIEHAMTSKIVTDANLPPDDVAAFAVSAYDKQVAQDGLYLGPDEKNTGFSVVAGRGRDSVAALAGYFSIVAQPEYKPEQSEQRFTIPMDSLGLDYVGVIDVIDRRGWLSDFKTTAGRPPTQHDADVSMQLTGYALAYYREHGKAPKSVKLDVLQDKGDVRSRVVLESQRTREDYERFLNRVAAAAASIRTGRFHPCPPESWVCSRRFCGYADRCPFWSGRD